MNLQPPVPSPATPAGRQIHALRSGYPPYRRRFDFRQLLAGLFVLAAASMVSLSVQAAGAAAVQGTVLDQAAQLPVQGAAVEILELGLSTSTDAQGRFEWSSIPLDQEILEATVVVRAGNYGTWTLNGVRLIRDETLILKVELTDSPQTITIPPLPADRPAAFAADTEMNLMLSLPEAIQDITFPTTVRVRVTGLALCNTSAPYTVETVDFKDYVKHVLPNEWLPSWPWESLRSGAMAAKMYAWYWIALGGKWDDADVYDSTCDQVYSPAVSYASTNQAVDDTWNWRLTRDDQLIQTQYRAYASHCSSADCMGQWDSRDMALGGSTWDEILFHFYDGTALTEVWDPPGGYSLRFDGVYNDEENRVLIAVDDPADSNPGPPVDVGAGDFTLEFWMKADPGENAAPAAACGANQNWIQGNMLFDRDRFGVDRDYGLSLAGGRIVFGVSGDGTGDLTICGTSNLADSTWHHVAVQRRASDGWIWLFVDGLRQAEGDGPDGDVSYPDDYAPPSTCGPSGTDSCLPFDPNLSIGSEKHRKDPASPSFIGWLDEVRFSKMLRYGDDFTRPNLPFTADANTLALYHFDEGVGNLVHDESGAPGGPSDGDRIYGGVINGPEWTWNTPWYVPPPQPVFAVPEASPRKLQLPNVMESGSNTDQWVFNLSTNLDTPTGVSFRFVIWLHIPETWQLHWGRQFSPTGAYSSGTLARDFESLGWIQTPGECPDVSSPASSGYKWRAWKGPLQLMPASEYRLSEHVILRGNLAPPSDAVSDQYPDLRWVIGTFFDSDNNGTPDTYHCSSVAASNITIP